MTNVTPSRLSRLTSGAGASERWQALGWPPPLVADNGERPAPARSRRRAQEHGARRRKAPAQGANDSRLSLLTSGAGASERWQALGVGPQRKTLKRQAERGEASSEVTSQRSSRADEASDGRRWGWGPSAKLKRTTP